jgi:hypothetical protein
MNKLITFLFQTLIIILALLVDSCTERTKENPFDPNSNTTPSINFTIKPSDDKAYLEWEVHDISDFDGLRLYRSVQNNNNFSLYKEFPPEATSFTDTALSRNTWYFYYLTLVGGSAESLPSPTVKILPGPGKIWILSRYGYNIRQLSYDLLHIIHTYNTNYPPINWDWDQSHNEIWLAHAQYRTISRLNLNIGHEDFFLENDFREPVDIKIDHQNDRIDVLDSKNRNIYFLQNNLITDSTSLDTADYFKICLLPQSRIAALSRYRAILLNSSGNIYRTFIFDSSYTGQDLYYDHNTLYILATNFNISHSRIISYESSSNQEDLIAVEGRYTILRKPSDKNYLWLGESLTSNSCRAVQLSLSGSRQLVLQNLSGNLDDIAVNPYDRSIVLVQRYSGNIILFDSTGELVSHFNQLYDPIKVFIE